MSGTFPLKGGRELDAFLAAFPKNLQRGAIGAGLRAGAKVVQDEARSRASKVSGKMAKSIKYGQVRTDPNGTMSIRIRMASDKEGGNSHWFLGLLIEYGVSPHLIARTGSREGRVAIRKAQAGTGTVENRAMKIGDDFVSGIISHPGFAAEPFFRVSLDVKAGEAVNAMRTRIVAYIEGKTGFNFDAGMDEAA